MTAEATEFRIGTKYRVTYLGQAGNYRWYRKVFVGTYLGDEQWDLRPAAGTATMPQDAKIVKVEETDTEHMAVRSA